MNWWLPIMAWLYIGITSSIARKSSSHNHGSRNREPNHQEQQPYDSKTSDEQLQHIKVPIIEAEPDNNPQDNGDYPKVYEENIDDTPPPNSAEFQAPSSEYEAPEYKPPNSGEIFNEDIYRHIVNSVTVPDIRFSGTDNDSDAPMDPDLHQIQDDPPADDDPPEIPPELVDIKIPTTIPKPNVKTKRKPKRRKKPSTPEPPPPPTPPPRPIKKPKKSRNKVKKIKSPDRPDPDQEKEYSQVVDNSNPKEEVLIIKPVKKKKPKSVFTNSNFQPDFQFPMQPRPRPKVRIPVTFYRNPTLKRQPKRINVVIQNRKKKPLLITHQNGDVIYWYPSKQAASRNAKYMCKRSRFGTQCVNLAPKRPVAHYQRRPNLNSYTFRAMKSTATPNYFDDFDNSDKDSLLLYKVIKDPKKKKIPGGLIKFSQSLFKDDNEEMGSFFKEIDDQGEDGIDDPEAENHEDERITDEEVDNDKATTDDEGQEQGEEGENEEPEQGENPNVDDEPNLQDYPE
ncbi:hypothetical protein WDU94_013334 [Cyamophila willieti]